MKYYIQNHGLFIDYFREDTEFEGCHGRLFLPGALSTMAAMASSRDSVRV